ncbi:hypothetical protein tinsulaeT_33830 [Thalassotalea insulae]|uniref:Uncharacterized protein n=1 Tax=Thalassotalea insulae TaxID=2056778 RepID=A0ABQ6GVU7_9GAMM|nr:hypothetical protein [Thalassotalea insulae]GLX80043.1 hypothetical protein tinsulaeT_33830 [Thalassotalea insulae]
MTNTEHLHQEGVLNKDDLSAEHTEAIDSLSKEEVEQLKSMNKNANKGKDKPVGIAI